MRDPIHIIIDGVDSVGKTTVCGLLSEKMRIPVTHMPLAKSAFTDKKMIEAFAEVYNRTLVQFKEFDFIIDRGFVTSLVYSAVYQRDEALLEYIKEIERELDPEIFILVNNNVGTLIERGDEVVPMGDIGYIQSVYRSLAEKRSYTVIDVRYKTPEVIVEVIIRILRSKGRAGIQSLIGAPNAQ